MKKNVINTVLVLLFVIGGLLFTSCNLNRVNDPTDEDLQWIKTAIDYSHLAIQYYETKVDAESVSPEDVPGISLAVSGAKKTWTFTNFDLALTAPYFPDSPDYQGHTLSGTYVSDTTDGRWDEEVDVTISGPLSPSGTFKHKVIIESNIHDAIILAAKLDKKRLDPDKVPNTVFPYA